MRTPLLYGPLVLTFARVVRMYVRAYTAQGRMSQPSQVAWRGGAGSDRGWSQFERVRGVPGSEVRAG